MNSGIQLKRIAFSGPNKSAEVPFEAGVNVICGASETGKSFLAEAIDFMLGAAELKELPERDGYSAIELKFESGLDEYKLNRSISGGAFALSVNGASGTVKLKASHSHGKVDNLSGFLLDKVGLFGRRILKNRAGKTISLSYRNLARLTIVQDGEIQQKGSPFLSGQYVLKTSDLATVKLLLTGIDDGAVIEPGEDVPSTARELALLDDLIAELNGDLADIGADKPELVEQLQRLEATTQGHKDALQEAQQKWDSKMALRRELMAERTAAEDRITEISEMMARFGLLQKHYSVDKARLEAIQESGSLLIFAEQVACPMCGADPEHQHLDDDCDGDVAAIVVAASAEVDKIAGLSHDLDLTVTTLHLESVQLAGELEIIGEQFRDADEAIRGLLAPELVGARADFADVIETRAMVQAGIALYDRLESLVQRKDELSLSDVPADRVMVESGIPVNVAHQLSRKIEHILRAWHFPGECRVHYDKDTSDFVIDGKPRGSRGQGLRAITHAAITIGLMEFCREKELPHPGFVVIDSPLLAYYEPEGEDDQLLQGSDLKIRFYEYLKAHHGRDGQVIIIENQHPPEAVEEGINIIVFTGNPAEGRYGLL